MESRAEERKTSAWRRTRRSRVEPDYTGRSGKSACRHRARTQVIQGTCPVLLNSHSAVNALNDVDYKWDEATATELGIKAIASHRRATCDYFSASGDHQACRNDDFVHGISGELPYFPIGHTCAGAGKDSTRARLDRSLEGIMWMFQRPPESPSSQRMIRG
ncbi:hypothetical protein BDY17DRAFT_136994 [Neohortaea acidophila]|uniref:Uncharacterized protein n=1 Tax=Neohortaea acidophila TaxID=245834 RepID=A0A6A6PS00_9PEZI|nr:uncharacterized protein BDY17DRAFT_136994 [Neohortaea acidophila]KAF2482880.1 hypothetical protein BDY17DRAFT_136994 [Neohortaea acidophila]